MNDSLQEKSIRASLARAGIDPEMFDVSAHMDRTLTYRENKRNIEHLAGRSHQRTYGAQHRESKSITQGEFYQIGRSHTEIDKQRKAKIPGVRRSASGKKYTERRKNRSDRPGWMV